MLDIIIPVLIVALFLALLYSLFCAAFADYTFERKALKNSLSPKRLWELFKYKQTFVREHPDYFFPSGLMVFCGVQGSGKTLSATQYIQKLSYIYPKAIIVTNTDLSCLNPESKVIPYDGIECLKTISNGEQGVIYFIDEIHLEFNSLESKNIPIEVMVEIAQQRKQRKHIIGTTQVFGRMAKPLREQINIAVICKKLMGCLQYNKFVKGEESSEEDGKIVAPVLMRSLWWHSPRYYANYDTFAKMRRYNDLWNGVPYSAPHNIDVKVVNKK